MFSRTLLARIILFAAAFALALINWGGRQASSQPQSEGRVVPYGAAESTPEGRTPTLTGAGHIDYQAIIRAPSGGWPVRIESDKILFTGDIGGGLGVHIAAADIHDKWTYLYYDPQGALAGTCDANQVRVPVPLVTR